MTKLATGLAALAMTLASGAAGAAFAQPPAPAAGAPAARPPQAPPPRGPSAADSLALAQAAIAACQAGGYKVGAVVTDSEGGVKLMLVDDGARARGAETALRKAFTAITFKKASSAVAADAQADKAIADKIAADPKMIAAAGAKLLMVGGTTIGAIGVGGAPGGQLDEACVDKAIAQVGPRLK